MEINVKTFCKMYVKLTTDDNLTTILFAVFWVSRLQLIFLASSILHKALYVMMYLRAFYYYFVHRKQHWCLQWKSFKFLIRIWMPLQNTSDVIGDVIKPFSNYSLSYYYYFQTLFLPRISLAFTHKCQLFLCEYFVESFKYKKQNKNVVSMLTGCKLSMRIIAIFNCKKCF